MIEDALSGDGPLLSQGNTSGYSNPMDLILSILMLGGLGLIAGAWLLTRRGERKKALLMLVAALVMFGNVALLVVPLEDGRTPTEAVGP